MAQPSAIKEATDSSAPSQGRRIISVERGSIADRLGLRPGDRLIKLNNISVEDDLDCWFQGATERLQINWIRPEEPNTLQARVIRKRFDELLGCRLEPFETRECSNRCVFCFVHQLPRGLRRELYVKDEDYRLSFLHGNYITGTNLTQEDRERIARLKLSPLYISVHATDESVRRHMLGRDECEPILPLLQWMAKRGIFMHTQIVLCPGMNDAEILHKTVSDLAALHPKLETVAIVPVGLTTHRQHLPAIAPVTPDYAARLLDYVKKTQEIMRRKIGHPLVFASDEFYLICGIKPPSYAKFPELPQLANGVGMYYRFHQEARRFIKQVPVEFTTQIRWAAITSIMGAEVIRPLVTQLNERMTNGSIEIIVAPNSLFGEDVTVTGLLPGADFQRAITENPGYFRYLIPRNALRGWDNRFLDDMLLSDLRAATGADVVPGGETAESFITAMLSPNKKSA